jgi:hypothetical protein
MLSERRIRNFLIVHLAGLIILVSYAGGFFPIYILYLVGCWGHFFILKNNAKKENPEAVKRALKWHFIRFLAVAITILIIAFLNQNWLILALLIYTFQLLILFISIKS